jgi:hypothetical protein
MTAELLAQSFASTRSILDNVNPDQIEAAGPTPCVSWSVKELVDHIVNGTTYFASAAETGTSPSEDGYPAFAARHCPRRRP